MLKVRLRRMGNRNRPFYRVVISDSRRAPTAATLEELGYYDPSKPSSASRLDVDRIDEWVSKGAQLSPTVKRLVKQQRQPEAVAAPTA
ncbi:MAG: 30S ribosomal protein S16 [Acidobacteriota bacterium]|nr:30S ribosomal protein S16 [Acidobacteriota bacterium]